TIANPIDARFFSGITAFTKTIGGTYTSGTSTFSGSIALHDSLTITSASGGTVAVTGVIAPGATGAQALNGTPGITKSGSGAVLLSGNNTYTGTTGVSAGKLLVNNTSGSGTGTGPLTIS